MRLGRRTRATAVVAAFGALAGCAPISGPLRPATPAELLAAVYSTPSARTVQARGRIHVATPKGGYSGAILLFYRSPDSLRAIIQVGLGTTIAEIGLAGGSGIAYLPQQHEAFDITPATGLDVGDAILYPSLLTRLLGPVEADRFPETATVTISHGRYVLRGRSPAGVRTWRIGGHSLRLESEDFVSAESTVVWTRDFRESENERAPAGFTVRLGGTTTTVKFTNVDVSPIWNPDRLRVRVPDDVQIIRDGVE